MEIENLKHNSLVQLELKNGRVLAGRVGTVGDNYFALDMSKQYEAYFELILFEDVKRLVECIEPKGEREHE